MRHEQYDCVSWCRYRQRSHVAIASACVAFVLTVVSCYGIWVGAGCLVFLPFISDLGIHESMRKIFVGGLLLEAMLLAVALPHVVATRYYLLSLLGQPAGWHRLNAAGALAGLAVVGGVGMLGFFPWDRNLSMHLVCAEAIFFGGTLWSVGGALVSRRVAHAAALHNSTACETRMQVTAAACSVFSGSLLSLCLSAGYLSDPENFRPRLLLAAAQHDFPGYCQGQLSWHQQSWVNAAALAEWLLVASLLAGIMAARAEVDLCQALAGRDKEADGRAYLVTQELGEA